MPPERVYDELKEYGAHIDRNADLGASLNFNPDMEQALYLRSDPLINLGLAQFGGSGKVQRTLYERSFADGEDADYGSAVRLAVLGNRHLACNPVDRDVGRSPLSDRELLRLAGTAGIMEGDELGTLLRNPGTRPLISDLFNRKHPFDQVAPELFYVMLSGATGNPCINRDDADKPGSDTPDFTLHDIQRGVWELLKSLPVVEGAIAAMYHLLRRLEPRRVYVPKEDPTPAIMRWRSVTPTQEFKWRKRYRYTELGFVEEFCCLAAALYGCWRNGDSENRSAVCIGAADSPDLIFRCAYYGSAQLTTEQLRTMHNRDGDVFTLAALCNATMIYNRTILTTFRNFGMLEPRPPRQPGDFANGLLYGFYEQRYIELTGALPEDQAEPSPTPASMPEGTIQSNVAHIPAIGRALKTESRKLWWVLVLLTLILVALLAIAGKRA